jgi:hypothetical protein
MWQALRDLQKSATKLVDTGADTATAADATAGDPAHAGFADLSEQALIKTRWRRAHKRMHRVFDMAGALPTTGDELTSINTPMPDDARVPVAKRPLLRDKVGRAGHVVACATLTARAVVVLYVEVGDVTRGVAVSYDRTFLKELGALLLTAPVGHVFPAKGLGLAAFSTLGTRVAVDCAAAVGKARCLVVFDLATGATLLEHRHATTVRCLAWSPSDHALAMGTSDGDAVCVSFPFLNFFYLPSHG